MKVAVVSESLHDSNAIINLLNRHYSIEFSPVLETITGSSLDATSRTSKLLQKELRSEDYSFVLYIRDLDASRLHREKMLERIQWFRKLNKGNGRNGVFLLNIYELEALILADIDTFNKNYGTTINFTVNPMHQSNPKEFLKDETRKVKKQYAEGHCPDLFKKLDIDKLIACEDFYFKRFIDDIEARINPK